MTNFEWSSMPKRLLGTSGGVFGHAVGKRVGKLSFSGAPGVVFGSPWADTGSPLGTTTVGLVRNKGFRGQRLERRLAQTLTGARKRIALRPFGRCKVKASATNGGSREWPKPIQEQESARTALHCTATVWLVRSKGFRGQRREQGMAQTLTGARKRKDCITLHRDRLAGAK